MTEKGAPGPALPQVGPSSRPAQPPKAEEPAWLTPALLVAAALFLYQVRRILTPFVIAAILAYLLTPAVGWIERRARIPRIAAVASVLLLVLAPLVVVGWMLAPTLVRETRSLLTNTPDIIRNLLVQLFGGESVEIAGQVVDASSVAGYLVGAALGFLGTPAEAIHVAATAAEAALDSFLTLVLLFYFLLDPSPFARAALRLIPENRRAQSKTVAQEIHTVMGHYVRGILFLVFLMASATWIGLALVFHLPYALPIAIATGFLEIIPFLGPVLAATIAGTVGLSSGGLNLALGIALFYLVLRQLEDQLVMPVVIGRAVEIHPAVAIFAVLSGSAVAGVLGALLAIPAAAALKVVFERWRPE